MFYILGKESCCANELFISRHGRPGTPWELHILRDQIWQFESHVCQQIEMSNDPVYKADVCFDHKRSRATPQHNCVSGEFI